MIQGKVGEIPARAGRLKDKKMFACKYCIITKGITIRDCFETEEELSNHMEMEHDLAIMRKGETEEEAKERVKAKNPRMGSLNCQCPACMEKRKASLLLN